MTKRLLIAFAFAAGLLTMGGPAPVAAQDVQITGPLAGAPACRHCRIYRDGRIQLQPFIGFTLQDEFSRTILTGAQVNYHFTDWLGLGAWGGFGAIHIDTGLTDEVAQQGQSGERNQLSLPSAAGFPDQIGKIQWMGAIQLSFIPLRGKLSLFQKVFIDTDFYIFGGIGAAGVEERDEVNNMGGGVCSGIRPTPAPCLASQTARASRVAIAPTFGVGLMLMANDFFGVSLEWRAMPFTWNTSGTDEAGPDGTFPDRQINSDDRMFHLNHMVNIGFAFYLPTAAPTSE